MNSKFYLIMPLLLLSGLAGASGPSLDEDCWKTASEQGLLMHGSATAPNPGARQWNLNKIVRYNQNHPTDSCADQIYSKATDDTQQYWDYIGLKYRCGMRDERRGQVCRNHELSMLHIRTMRNIYTDIENGKPYPRHAQSESPCKDILQASQSKVLNQDAQKTIQDASQVVTEITEEAPKEDSCAGIPEEERRKPGDSHVLLTSQFWLHPERCEMEMGKGFGSTTVFAYTMGAFNPEGESNLDLSPYAVSMTEIVMHPLESSAKLTEGFMQYVLPSYSCLNNKTQAAAICNTIGDLGGLLFGGGLAYKSLTWLGKKLLGYSMKFGGTFLLDAIGAKFPKSAKAIAQLKKFADPKFRAQLEAEARMEAKAQKAAAEAKQVRGSPNKNRAMREKAYEDAKQGRDASYKNQEGQAVEPKTEPDAPGVSSQQSQSAPLPKDRLSVANDRVKNLQAEIKNEAKQAELKASQSAREAGKSESEIKTAGDSAYGDALSKAGKSRAKEMKNAEREYSRANDEIDAARAAATKP